MEEKDLVFLLLIEKCHKETAIVYNRSVPNVPLHWLVKVHSLLVSTAMESRQLYVLSPACTSMSLCFIWLSLKELSERLLPAAPPKMQLRDLHLHFTLTSSDWEECTRHGLRRYELQTKQFSSCIRISKTCEWVFSLTINQTSMRRYSFPLF